MISKTLISNFILPNFTTHPPQHSHLYYIHFAHILLLDWLTLCSIGHSWSNRRLVKFSLQSCCISQSQSTPKAKSPLQPSRVYPMFNIFINLPILTNYRDKVTKRISVWHLMGFNSHSSFNSLYMLTKVAIQMFCLCTTYF